jgi:hypothetical protein
MNHQVASFANRRNNGCLRSSTARRRWAWLGTEGEAWLVSPATLGLRQVPPLALSLLRAPLHAWSSVPGMFDLRI